MSTVFGTSVVAYRAGVLFLRFAGEGEREARGENGVRVTRDEIRMRLCSVQPVVRDSRFAFVSASWKALKNCPCSASWSVVAAVPLRPSLDRKTKLTVKIY